MYKEIWARVGIVLKLTDAEIEQIFTEEGDSGRVVMKAITEGRYYVDGDGYIPEGSVCDFNTRYNTQYECGDYDIST